jgi:hypothetical protein
MQTNKTNPVIQHKQHAQQLQCFSTTVVTGFLQNWQVIETGEVLNSWLTTFITCG